LHAGLIVQFKQESSDLAPDHSVCRLIRRRWLGATSLPIVLIATAASAALLNDFLRAADQGQCIESVVFQNIRQRGPEQAGAMVRAAVAALAERGQQQRALGCEGDIAAQAIAAGADPDEVLRATAAGL
jgi:hypothetical protein